jgi:hypothetical protein
MKYYVEIVDYETGEVVKRFGPVPTERQADRVEGGIEINLNHEKYFTRTVEEDK